MRTKIVAGLLLIFCLSLSSFAAKVDHKMMITTPFKTPQEVTAKCIMCHKKQADEFGQTRHWNWEGKPFKLNGKTIKLGKKSGMTNNFCINIQSNWPRCTSCHAGYGWKDNSFDFSKQENMDCLVCHDTTGTYKKFPTDAGYPVYDVEKKMFEETKEFLKVDLLKVAQSVGKSTTKTCGACHFYGGGGHQVKNGVLDKSATEGDPEIDVHMNKLKMSCGDCHAVKGSHKVRGALHASMAAGDNHFDCTVCHTKGHKNGMAPILDKHAKSIACQTCHVPTYAKKYPTKTWWDWTSAGDKKRNEEKDADGNITYTWKKGDFKWAKNLVPEYRWHNGKTDYITVDTPIADASKIVEFNALEGNFNDAKSKITPFKIMRGKQYYDPETKLILVPKLFGPDGYWKTANWLESFEKGMKEAGLKFSGKFEPVETVMYWPLDHMIAPAKSSLKCIDCHAEKSRIDWKALGYPGDPQQTGQNRTTMKIIK